MSVVRRFLVGPALARLIRKERGGSRITEGYFAPQGGRTSLVRIDGQQCHLVLITAGGTGEERTEVPRAHGDALLDVCGGKAVYERTTLALGTGPEAVIDRYVTPAGLDLISVSFDDEQASKAFRLPIWFGPDVSDNAAYDRHAVALQGVPEAPKMGLSNAMLDAVLDLVEPRFGLGRFGGASIAPPAAAPKPADTGAAAPRPVPPSPAAATPPLATSPVPPPAAKPAPQPVPAAAASNAAVIPPAAAKPVPQPPPKPVVVDAATAAKPSPEQPARPPAPQQPPAAAKPAPETPAKPDAPPPPTKPEEAKPPAAAQAEPKPPASETQGDAQKGDARIDDVIESLSQALGAAIQQPQEPSKSDDLAASFERWTVRPRRTQQ